MFNSLYSKLAIILAILFGTVGLIFMLVTLFSTDMYQQEVNQKLNSQVADHIVSERLLMKEQQVDESALKDVFHMLMVVNPSVEIYLLDPKGRILSYSAPPGKVKASTIDIDPISKWLKGDATFPLLGEDPRNPGVKKAFTAARIPKTGDLQGYLYVILGGEEFDSVAQKLKTSYILRLSAWMIAASMFFALITGLLLFASLTGRLKRLANAIDAFREGRPLKEIQQPLKSGSNSTDEIGRLSRAFQEMAGHIEQQMEDLIQSDNSRRDLIANVSHDLRTPLATLQGYVETLLLKDDTLSKEERHQYLKIAIKHCDHLNRLVDHLLELAKLDSPGIAINPELFNIRELLQDVSLKFDLKAREKSIVISLEAPEHIPYIVADIGLIERVLENLLDNAIRFTPENGMIKLVIATSGTQLKLSISDTGPGIPADEIPRLFSRFHQVDKSRKIQSGHSGLGLAISKRIMELHKGKISVNSELNQGTTFTIQMPFEDGPHR